MADLDGFKRHNDIHGHHEGDRVLQLTANVIRANCREVDLVARYGGDEFCVLMPHTMPDDAAEVARRVAREFDIAFARHSPSFPAVAVSIGVAHVDLSAPINAEMLLVHADEAMYAAKTLPGSRVLVKRREGVRAA
jgi:diguanylate cyclase (GGDEF)-like protein